MRLTLSACLLAAVLLAAAGPGPAEAQFFQNLANTFGRGIRTVFSPVMHMFHRPRFNGGGAAGGSNALDNTGGTKKPVATGHDNPFPDDCGRDPKKGTGLLCFPDGKLCQESKKQGRRRTLSAGAK